MHLFIKRPQTLLLTYWPTVFGSSRFHCIWPI